VTAQWTKPQIRLAKARQKESEWKGPTLGR